MGFGIRVEFEPVREIDFGSISGTYTALGAPLTGHTRLVSFQNQTNQDVYVSFNGVDDHLRLASNSFKLLDVTSNRISDDSFTLSVGEQLFVRYVGALGASGTFWAEAMFGAGGK